MARSALARLRSKGLDNLSSSSVWMVTLMAVCEAAHALGDADAAGEAYRLLEPFADLPVMASLGIACFGSAHRPLGLAAWTMGDVATAIMHLEQAERADLAMEHGPSHAISLARLADVVEVGGDRQSAQRTTELRATAVREATRYGMSACAHRWRRPKGVRASVACQRQGRTWLVTVGDRTASVPHNVGMVYLYELIANEGTAIPAIELASSYSLAKGRRADAILDDKAKAQYRQRISDLRADIDDADNCADLERAARARAELDILIEALAQATGLRGRERLLNDDGEKARVSVRKAICRALATIEEADPEVATALRGRVVTGAYCLFLTARPE